jgi:hypothetical protein
MKQNGGAWGLKHVLAADEPPAFDAKASYGYPKWLEIKARRGGR